MQLAAQRRKHSNVDHYVCHKPIPLRDQTFRSSLLSRTSQLAASTR